MALSSFATGERSPSGLSRDHSIFLRIDRIADNSEEKDSILLFRRLTDEMIEYKTTRTNRAKRGPPYLGSNRDEDRLVIDSTIQEIIVPGLSIVFPHIPMTERRFFLPCGYGWQGLETGYRFFATASTSARSLPAKLPGFGVPARNSGLAINIRG